MSCHVMSCHVMSCHVMSCQRDEPKTHTPCHNLPTYATHTHVNATTALEVRYYGVPVLAPYFHMAFGWGISASLEILSKMGFSMSSIFTPCLAALLGPALGMLWDPALRILERAASSNGNNSRGTAALAIMAATVFLPAILPKYNPPSTTNAATSSSRTPKKSQTAAVKKTDYILLAIGIINAVFFVTVAALSNVHNPSLRITVYAIGGMSTALFAKGCGLL